MKKLFALIVGLCFAGASTGYAEVLGLGKATFDGSLEVLAQHADNETDFGGTNDHRGNTITRVRVGMELPEITEGVSGRVEAVRNSSGAGPVQYGQAQATSVHAVQTSVQIQNAYVDIQDFLRTDKFRLGRQYGGRKGDLLLYYGPVNDDALSVNAFDSLLVKKKIGLVDAVFSTGKVLEDDATPGTTGATDAGDVTGDVNLSYLILSSDALFPAVRLPLELGYYQVKAHNGAATNNNQTLIIYDLRAKYGLMEDALWLGFEYAMNDGQDNNNNTFLTPAGMTDYKGSAYVMTAAYEKPEDRFSLKLVYANASGDGQNPAASRSSDKSFHDGGNLGFTSSDFRYGEILTNSMNNLAATTPPHLGAMAGGVGAHPGLDTGDFGVGLNVIGLGGRYTPAMMDGKTTFKADYFLVKANKVVGGASKDVGNEIDVAAIYRHSGAVSASLGYAMLSPGTGLASGFAANPGNVSKEKVTKAFAKLIIRWGSSGEEAPAPAPAAPKARPQPRRR